MLFEYGGGQAPLPWPGVGAGNSRREVGRATVENWTETIGGDRDRLSERAPRAADRISPADIRCVFKRALEARTDVAMELGTGSGFATAVLCYAAETTRVFA